MSTAKSHSKKSSGGAPLALVIVLCALVAILIALLIILVVVPRAKDDGGASAPAAALDEWYDHSAKVGNLPGRTEEEIIAELNKIVEEGMFNISIASIIVFEDGNAEGAARIENIPANPYNMSVTISLDEGDEVIYESKGLAPGQYIETIKLLRDLEAGEYSATALFTAYTLDTLQKVGQAAAKITIVVER